MSELDTYREAPPRHSRRFYLTPAPILYAVLLAEVCLLLSDQFRWYVFNVHKGWTVLICLATVAVVILLFSVWFVAARVFRRRFQFSIRSMLALILVVAIACGWLATEMERARRQADLVAKASNLGCGILYDYNLNESGDVVMVSGVIPGATRLNRVLGDDFFREVVGAQPRTDEGLQLFRSETPLRRLDGGDSQVTDAGMESLKRLKRLEWLDLRGAPLVTDAGLQHIRELSRLRQLLLRRTGVTDAGMIYLKDLKKLEVLDLGMTKVTDVGMKNFAGLIHVRQLSFWANKIEDAGLVYVQPMTELEILELGFAPVTDAGLKYLEGLTHLRLLNIRGSSVTDAGLRHLEGLRQLRELDLYKTRISDAGLEHLTGLVRLELLRLGETQVTAEAMKKLQQVLPNCKIEM